MNNTMTWLAAAITVGVLLAYELALLVAQRRNPQRLARTAHAALREDWFLSISAYKGSEVLAVQTLRNSVMSATMTASTAVLGLMGTVTLAAPSLRDSLGGADIAAPHFTPRLALELVLLALLFASLFASTMAVRYYNHAGFVSAMPVDSDARQRWSAAGITYVRKAGVLYSWGLHYLILVAPILASILHPLAGPFAAVLVVGMLYGFDRFQSRQQQNRA